MVEAVLNGETAGMLPDTVDVDVVAGEYETTRTLAVCADEFAPTVRVRGLVGGVEGEMVNLSATTGVRRVRQSNLSAAVASTLLGFVCNSRPFFGASDGARASTLLGFVCNRGRTCIPPTTAVLQPYWGSSVTPARRAPRPAAVASTLLGFVCNRGERRPLVDAELQPYWGSSVTSLHLGRLAKPAGFNPTGVRL